MEQEIEYLKDATVSVFGKRYFIPREHTAYGDSEYLSYRFSGTALTAKRWTPTLLTLKNLVEKETNLQFNFVVINRYKDGHCTIGQHKDNERQLNSTYPVTCLSLGACRNLLLTSDTSPSLKYLQPLRNGSLLLIPQKTNLRFKHGIPKQTEVTCPRISLTFRDIISPR